MHKKGAKLSLVHLFGLSKINRNYIQKGREIRRNEKNEKSTINRMNSIDLGVEFGKRGTLNNNLIRQNFINLRVGINFADKWFGKRLYN